MTPTWVASVPKEDTPILETTWEEGLAGEDDMISVKQWDYLLPIVGTALPPDYVLYRYRGTLLIHAIHGGSFLCPKNWVLV